MRYAVVALAILTGSTLSHGQGFVNTEQVPLSATVTVHKAALTSAGTLYIVGSFSGTASFGTNTMTSSGGTDAFIASYNRQLRSFDWVSQGGGALNDSANDLAFSPQGDVYVVGTFVSSSVFEGTTLTALGSVFFANVSNLYLAKYSQAGQLLWVQQSTASVPTLNGLAVTVGPNGEVYTGGNADEFGHPPEATLDSWNADGVLLGQNQFPGTGTSIPRSPAVKFDSLGNLYFAEDLLGSLPGLWVLLPSAPALPGSPDPLPQGAFSVGKMGRAGTAWRTPVTGSGGGINAISLGSDNSITAVGAFTGIMNFSVTNLAASSINDSSSAGFVARWGADGQILWAKKMRERGSSGTGVWVDPSGASYIVEPSQIWGSALYKFSSDGSLSWSFQPEHEEKFPRYLDVTGFPNEKYFLIQTSGGITLGNQTFTNLGGGDLFISLFSEEIPPVFTINPGIVPFGFRLGSDATFTADTRSVVPVSYQWQHDQIEIPGQTNVNLSISNAQLSDRGGYRLLASNQYGVSTSAVGRLEIYFHGAFHAEGSGQIAVSPSGGTYAAFSEVSLVPVSDDGTQFLRWGGDATGTEEPLKWIVSSNFFIDAFFSDYQTNIIVDDLEAQFIGNRVSSNTNSTAYRGSFTVLSHTFRGTNPFVAAIYRPNILQSGSYDIYAWYPSTPLLRLPLTYSISTAAGSTNILVDERVNAGSWFLIEKSQFLQSGTNSYIQISDMDSPTQDVLADAVRFVLSSAPTKAEQVIAFADVPPLRFASAGVQIAATSSSGLPVTLEVTSGPALISGGLLLASGIGTAHVRAIQEGNDQFNAATNDIDVVIQKGLQTITFTSPNSTTLGTGPIPLTASASSGLPVSFELVAGAADFTDAGLVPKAEGLVIVRALQDGSELFEAAPPSELTFAITKAFQAITFLPVGDTTMSAAPLGLFASASSGLPITFSVLSGNAVLFPNGLLVPKTVGDITVVAEQSGNEIYQAAADVARTFHVGKGSQTIHFEPPSDVFTYDGSLALVAESTSGLPVSLSVVSGPAQISGNQLVPQSAGPIVVSATQGGDLNFDAAPEVVQTIMLLPPPALFASHTAEVMQIIWGFQYADFVLETAARPEGPWTSVTSSEVKASGQYTHSVDATVSEVFFRLRRSR